MLIRFIDTSNHYDYIKDSMLDYLIESGQIAKFRRRTGWVTIGEDNIRSFTQNRMYFGFEKRASADTRNFH